MEISSSNTNTQSSSGVEAIKKSMDTQERQALKILESLSEESQKVAAQKTGVGVNLNIAG
ncbi:hypothetical protein [Sulfurimonas sp.]|uniref:hypothetical protein n=1 Tax=Sulfurimonas sp. TaxID=2022749 RepID=UPI003D107EF1